MSVEKNKKNKKSMEKNTDKLCLKRTNKKERIPERIMR